MSLLISLPSTGRYYLSSPITTIFLLIYLNSTLAQGQLKLFLHKNFHQLLPSYLPPLHYIVLNHVGEGVESHRGFEVWRGIKKVSIH